MWYHSWGQVIAATVVTAIGLTLGRAGGVGPVGGDGRAEADDQDAGLPTTELIDPNSIVVLPFLDLSGEDQEFMSDVIAAELLTLLARIPELKVPSRTSAFSFKDTDLTVPEIAAQLGVAHVLEGTVRMTDNAVRISVSLIDPRSDVQLFSEDYDRPLDDIFAVQDEIAAKVVSELRVTLLGDLPKQRETDPEAYTLFLQARGIADTGFLESYETAIPMLERVLEIDPNYAPAYVELAAAYADQGGAGIRPFEEGNQMALDAAERAVALDPDFAYAHAMLGSNMAFGGDWEGLRHVERALEMAPTDTEVIMLVGHMLDLLGRLDESILAHEYVADRDPVYAINLWNLGVRYFFAERWEDAAATFRTYLALMGYCLKSTAHYMLWSWRFRLLSSVAAWTIPVRGWSWTSSSPTMRHAWSTWRVCAGRKGLCAWAVAGWERSGEHRGGVSSAHTVEGRPRCWREPCSTARARPCVCGFSLPGSSRARNTEPMLSGSSACSEWEATRQRGSGSTSSAGPWSDRIATS